MRLSRAVRPVKESCCCRCSWSVGSCAANCVKSSRSSSSRREPPVGLCSSPKPCSSAKLGGSSRLSSRRISSALLLAQRFAAFGWRAIRWRRRSRLVGRAEVGSLEEGVFSQVALQLLVELHRAQLQQPDGLLQLRREGEVLR